MNLNRLVLGSLLVMMAFSLTSMALDTKVYTLCEDNLSINLTPGFRIVPDEEVGSSDGFLTQSFTIVSSQTKGMAMLQIMNVYGEDTMLLGPEFISNTWMMGVNIGTSLLGNNDDYSDRIIRNWYALDYMGNNVTISTLSTNATLMSALGKTADASNWNIGENKYAGLISFFDKNTTMQIIGSLKLN